MKDDDEGKKLVDPKVVPEWFRLWFKNACPDNALTQLQKPEPRRVDVKVRVHVADPIHWCDLRADRYVRFACNKKRYAPAHTITGRLVAHEGRPEVYVTVDGLLYTFTKPPTCADCLAIRLKYTLEGIPHPHG